MNKKYKEDIKCNICGLEFSTGECKTKIGMWIRKKTIMKKHYHTRAEVVGYNMFGIYIPTAKKKWENNKIYTLNNMLLLYELKMSFLFS